MLVTIPYDEGWHIKIDGEEIEYFESLDSLIGFNVGMGEHTVEITYMPKAFSLGLAVSVVSLALFILIIIFEKFVFALIFGKKSKTLCVDIMQNGHDDLTLITQEEKESTAEETKNDDVSTNPCEEEVEAENEDSCFNENEQAVLTQNNDSDSESEGEAPAAYEEENDNEPGEN